MPTRPASSSDSIHPNPHSPPPVTDRLQVICVGPYKVQYAGPNGISDVSEIRLGRFESPILRRGVLYDRTSTRFYTLDFEKQIVRAGPELKDQTYHPIAIGRDSGGSRSCWVHLRTKDGFFEGERPSDTVVVLNPSGQIALLDVRTLTVVKYAGMLPRPRTLFGRGSQKLRDLSGYYVDLVTPGGKYIGMVAGSLSRQGDSLTVATFDKDGKEIKTASTRAFLFEAPWGSSLAVAKYFFESLHPPVLTLASFFTAYSFDVGATHRALFLMPNSFVAQQRDRQTNLFLQLLWALLFMLPAILFAGLLSWRVAVDAKALGLSTRARRIWMAGTFAFGLPAYITYRLVRPKCVLMVCRDCGRGRRVDRDVCHHCGRGWDSPELEPPAWRVVGRQETAPQS